MLMVKWSDLAEKLIFRTYPEIYTFHVSVLFRFFKARLDEILLPLISTSQYSGWLFNKADLSFPEIPERDVSD